MKKTSLILIILTLSVKTCFCQENETNLPKRDTQKNDLSVNLHPFVLIEGFSINYDRVLNENTSIGLHLFKSFDNEDNFDNSTIDLTGKTNFTMIPNIKYYVGKRFARRFYVQGLAMISSGKNIEFLNNTIPQETNFTDVGLGFGIGDKRILKNGIFIDFGIAIAYNIFSKNSPDLLAHPNLSFGYRF